MSEPKRVKITGGLFRGKVPDGAVYVGRAQPGLKQSPFANPWCIKTTASLSWKQQQQCLSFGPGEYVVRHHRDMDRIAGGFGTREAATQAAVNMFRVHMDERPDLRAAAVEQLRGKDLACWCKPDEACHADVLLEIANGGDLS